MTGPNTRAVKAMKSTAFTACGVLVLLLSAHPDGVLPAAAEDDAVSDGSTTNGLIFKKRTRRMYTSEVSINRPEGAVSAPVEEEKDDRAAKIEPNRQEVSVGRNSVQRTMQITPRMPSRQGKDRKKDEEDWLLTPQQRIQKEIDLLSGKQEEEEEESAYGWLADEVESLRDEKIKEQERRRKQEEEEAEAEEIAAIMGRDLFGSAAEKRATGLLRDDRGRLQLPAGSEQRGGFGADGTNGISAPSLRVQDEDRRDAAMARRPAGGVRGADAAPGREDAKGSPASSTAGGPGTVPGIAAKTPDHESNTADGRKPSSERGAQSAELQPVSTGVPSIFSWNQRSGGGYAGLPASVAPSIMPAQGAASAGIASGGWTVNSGGSPGSQGSPGGLSRLSETRYSYTSPGAGLDRGIRASEGSPAGGAATIRTPFMSPMTPGLQGGSGYGTLPARRP